MNDDIDLGHLVSDYMQYKNNRRRQVEDLQTQAATSQEIDLEELLMGFVNTINSQHERILELEFRVTKLENPDWNNL